MKADIHSSSVSFGALPRVACAHRPGRHVGPVAQRNQCGAQFGGNPAPIRRADEAEQIDAFVQITADLAIEIEHGITPDQLRRLAMEDDVVGIIATKGGEVGAVESRKIGFEP